MADGDFDLIADLRAALNARASEDTLAAIGVILQALPNAQALTLAELLGALPIRVEDRLGPEVLKADALGADAVITFELGQPASLVVVNVDNVDPDDDRVYICRASLGGTNPRADLGHRCRSGQANYIPFPCTGTVKVFAPLGVSVSVEAG